MRIATPRSFHEERRDTVPLGPFQSALELEIKERRRAEEALWNAEAIWRALVDAALDGILLCDLTGRIQSFNRAAERLFGYAARDVQGRNVTMLLSSPDGDEQTTGACEILMSTVVTVSGREAIARRNVRHRDFTSAVHLLEALGRL